MKKLITLVMVFCFVVVGFDCTHVVFADDADNPKYFCDISSEYYDKDRCYAYAKEQNGNIKDLQEQMNEAKKNMEAAQRLATTYAQEAAALDDEITSLSVQIGELQDRIDELQEQIDENNRLVEELTNRVLTRMANAQKTMHFNEYLDFILGSSGFSDMVRRLYGVRAIMNKEESDREELSEVLEQLMADKKEQDEKREELQASKDELVEKQQEFLVKEAYYREIEKETAAEVEEMQNQLESIKKSYSSVLKGVNISGLPSSEGMTSPISGSSISAGVWHYPASFGGGVHLGVDYAVKVGTTITAPMNGVVIVSADGCNTYGYLGCSCAGSGGVAYGGNQVIMIGSAIGSDDVSRVYGVSFFHMQAGSPTGTGPIFQGDYIGRVGASGNTTGPHSHIELYYLGRGDMEDIQDDYLNRNYSLSFNTGWGSSGLYTTCSNTGFAAPCRLDPRDYFGS